MAGELPPFKFIVVINGGVDELFVGIIFCVGVVDLDTLELKLDAELEFVDSLGLLGKFIVSGCVGNALSVLCIRLLTMG